MVTDSSLGPISHRDPQSHRHHLRYRRHIVP